MQGTEGEGSTTVHFEQFQDLSQSTYDITIGRVQQLALQKAGGPVPIPTKQLELLSKKQGKEQRSYLIQIIGQIFNMTSIWVYSL